MAPAPPSYLAIDLGASSGRAVLGTLERLPQGWRVATRDVRRFRVPMIEEAGHLYWHVEALWDELRTALAAAPVPRSTRCSRSAPPATGRARRHNERAASMSHRGACRL